MLIHPAQDDSDNGEGAGSSSLLAEAGAGDAAELPAALPLAREQQQPQRQPPTFRQVAARAVHEHAAMHTKLMAVHAGVVAEAQLAAKDAIQFFENIERKPSNRQQLKGLCMACGKSVSSTASTRLLIHIVKCPLMPADIKKGFKSLQQLAGDKSEGKRVAECMAAEDAAIFGKKHAAERDVLRQAGIKASLQGAENAWADKCIAEFFYANAIPFSVADADSGGLYRRMVAAIKATPPGYRPPNKNKIGGELLDTCYDGLWQTIKERDPEGKLVYKFGSTYVTDGWDSCDNLSLINSAFITNNDGGLFWRSVDTSGHEKCAEYTAGLMIEDIYNYGPTKVVMICTDTCAVMQKAWDIVMHEFPWISALPCQPHVISLLLKDIGKTAEVSLPAASCSKRGQSHAHMQCSQHRAEVVTSHSSALLCSYTFFFCPGDPAGSGRVGSDSVVLQPPLPAVQAARADFARAE